MAKKAKRRTTRKTTKKTAKRAPSRGAYTLALNNRALATYPTLASAENARDLASRHHHKPTSAFRIVKR